MVEFEDSTLGHDCVPRMREKKTSACVDLIATLGAERTVLVAEWEVAMSQTLVKRQRERTCLRVR